MAEVPTVAAYTNSAALLAKIVQKSGLNLTDKDVWVEKGSIDYTGGTSGKNWLFQCVDNSIYFKDTMVLWLHR
ncbi:hypothetical protein D3C78_1612280 [compost metagenome]